MNRRTVQFDSTIVDLAMDDAPAAADRMWALVRLRVVDELTGAAPLTAITVTTELRGCTPRVGLNGLCGLVGSPRQVFPGLATQAYPVRVRVSAEGFVGQDLEVSMPLDANFPQGFNPPPLVEVELRRLPVVIQGRVIGLVGAVMVPMPAATVSLIEIWRRPPAAGAAGPPEIATLVSLGPPVYSSRAAAAGGSLRGENLSSSGALEWTLTEHLSAGSSDLPLSAHQGLAAGDVLWVDADRPELSEYVRLAPAPAPTTPDQQYVARLESPMAYPHPRGAITRLMGAAAAGPLNALAYDAAAGDASVFLTTTTGLAAATHATLSAGGAGLPVEHHDYQRLSVTADAEGYYRLPPLTRAGQVRVRAESGPRSAQPLFRPDYTTRENRLDLVI